MKRLLTAITAAFLTVSLLAGCSGIETKVDDTKKPTASQSSDGVSADAAPGAGTKYCKLLSTDFATMFANIQGPDDVTTAVGVIEQIADEAPAEVEEEWAVMRRALSTMKASLTQAAELQERAAAGDVSQKQLQAQTAQLTKDMEALSTPENNQAGEVVSAHATKYCGLPLA